MSGITAEKINRLARSGNNGRKEGPFGSRGSRSRSARGIRIRKEGKKERHRSARET